MLSLFLKPQFILIPLLALTISNSIAQNADTTITGSETPKEVAKPKSSIDFTKTSKVDMIKFLDGNIIEVDIQKISEKFITYNKPGDINDIEYVDRRKVQAIHFRSGRIETMSEKVVEIRKIGSWDEVKLTDKPEDVKGMVEVRNMEVKLVAQTRHHYYKPETLESSAEIIMKKNAALENAEIVLITKRAHHRAYGDPPSVILVGIAYRK
jgi:hypothetical protein